MLYLDYSRDEGRWVPNRFGGRENIEAIDFIRELNAVIRQRHPGVLMIAEESTSWPLVSKGTDQGGLGFDFKWNMGWMNDTLEYFKRDPFFRRYFHNNLTFGLTYAWSENFVLPFSHDEVVHLKGSLLNKMPGTREQKFANLRALYGYMWAHPGKKLLFMGGELGQWREWNDAQSLDWHLLDEEDHRGVRLLVRDLNNLLAGLPPLYELDVEPRGFRWVDVDNSLENILAFMRTDAKGASVVCVCNFSAVPRRGYRLGLPEAGEYRVILNTDAPVYAGTGQPQAAVIQAEERPWHNLPFSVTIDLPPLTTLWLETPPKDSPDEEQGVVGAAESHESHESSESRESAAPAAPVEPTAPAETAAASAAGSVEPPEPGPKPPPAPKPRKPRAPRKKPAPAPTPEAEQTAAVPAAAEQPAAGQPTESAQPADSAAPTAEATPTTEATPTFEKKAAKKSARKAAKRAPRRKAE
jgi:1,4-alpha-glucan branching enzyme